MAENNKKSNENLKTGEKEAQDKPQESETTFVHKGQRHAVSHGVVCIKATFNNTLISVTDTAGNVIAWSSAGRVGFQGSKKSTAYAASIVAKDAAKQAIGCGVKSVEIKVQGVGAGRESAIRALESAGLIITSIKDVTPVPHNGCRPRKRRRV